MSNWMALYWLAPGTGSDGATHVAGQLISIGNVVALTPAQIAAKGWGSADIGPNPPAAGTVWNTTSLSFVTAPNPSTITAVAFVERFTGAEWLGINGASSTDGNISKFLFELQLLGGQVILTGSMIQNALTYLVNHGLLTAPRAAVIGTP